MKVDQNRLQMRVLKRRLIIWDGDQPEDAHWYPDPSKHPKCLEIREKDGEGAVRTIYRRGNAIWL